MIGLLSAGVLTLPGDPSPEDVDYASYGGDPGPMRYSTLTQINAAGVFS